MVRERGWELVSDPAAIAAAADAALAAEGAALAEAAAALAAGDEGRVRRLSGYLVGKAIAASGA